MTTTAAALPDQARHVCRLAEAVRDDDLDGLCEACGAAKKLVGALEVRIRRLVERQDRDLSRAPERRASR